LPRAGARRRVEWYIQRSSQRSRPIDSHVFNATPGKLWCVALLVASTARAQDSSRVKAPARLPTVVTVTRDVGRSPFDLPYAITTIQPDSLTPGQTHTFVAQTLSLLPGVTVADRTNPSQDTRISIRGFGARSQFGARSIRILRDGMPLTLPDGQTPIDYLDLESVGRVEVIRGSMSALYGNASGGVIDLHSADPPTAPAAEQLRSWTGSSGLQRVVGLFGGTAGATTYQGNIGHTKSDGYRAFSNQRLTNAFIRATSTVAGTDLALDGMGLEMPVAQNPGALTLAQVDSAPRQADPASEAKLARKAVHQVQIGLSAHRAVLGDGEVVAQGYGGTRSLYNPLTFAVVGVDRRQSGAGARLTLPWKFAGFANRVSVGADAQWLDDARRNWANCNAVLRANASCASLPEEKGALSLDQNELVSSFGPYLRDELTAGRLHVAAGIRSDAVRFQLRDHFLADGRDDSGDRTLHAVSPMAGLAYRLSTFHSLYANVGSAFETPTTTELGNQADGSAGLNSSLKPQFSTTYETGAKGLLSDGVRYDVALFDTEVRDELIPFEVPNGNGRTFYRNAGRTRRQGIELAGDDDIGPLSIDATYALSSFHFRDFVNDGAQFAGNAIPGIPEQQAQLAATWRLRNAFLLAEGQAKSRVFVNDANDAAAPGFVVLNLRAGATAAFGRPWLSPVVGAQNLFDRHYVGSVAVNASGPTIARTKFYEPAPGRTWYIGVSAATNPW
jgi:iron complex outermembrane recepter protein